MFVPGELLLALDNIWQWAKHHYYTRLSTEKHYSQKISYFQTGLVKLLGKMGFFHSEE